MDEYVLIIGATSDIAKAIAYEYANKGYNLYLATRHTEVLETFATDIKIRHNVDVKLLSLDIMAYSTHNTFYEGIEKKPIGLISAIGYLGNQQKAQNEFIETQTIIDTNYIGLVSLFNIIANDFEKRGSGFIVGISSVAGDRGRKSNYIYGSAKAAFSTYLSGLRNRLFESGVHVLTVKPGFVETKMTAGMDLPTKLTAKPVAVAKDIYYAQQKKKSILYTKWIWRWIMLIIRHIPEFQFKKMSI